MNSKRISEIEANPEIGVSKEEVFKGIEISLVNDYQFHPEANAEFKEPIKWHEHNRKNSGKEFAEQILERIKEITQKPESRFADADGVRWTGVLNFSYHIFCLFKLPIFF